MKSVFVLEDNPIVLKNVAASIEANDELCVVGSAIDLSTALSWLKHNDAPDVALVDLGLPDGDGTLFIKELSTNHQAVLSLVMTVFGDERHVIRALEAGAQGYLLKESHGEGVTNAILDLIKGGSPISPSIAGHLLKRFRSPTEQTPKIELTDKEVEVLNLIVKGYSYQEIATSQGLSVNTISTHVRHIYRKLAVNSRGEAVYEAIQLGLVSTEFRDP